MCYYAFMNNATPPSPPQSLHRLLDPELFRALGDATRLALLARLAGAAEPQTVSQLQDCCGVHLSGVSRHLKILHTAGVVNAERRGREVLYRLDCAAWAEQLRGLAAALERCAECCRGGECRPNPEPSQTL